MKNSERIIIERVENGFMVRPDFGENRVWNAADILVFNDLGFASCQRADGSNTSLTVFIADHFRAQE